jgi:hypothetical protein
MPQTNFTDNVRIDGSRDIAQLAVEGNATQTQPLQTWQNSAGSVLSQVTGDGRVLVGDDLGAATPDALIEAHRSETSTARPRRGIHSLGRIGDSLSEIAQWMVAELELRGSGALQALQNTLRVRLTNMTTAAAGAGAELRAADIEVVNDASANAAAVPAATGLQVSVTNAAGRTITRAIGVRISMNNAGTMTNRYALFTEGAGPSRLEECIELRRINDTQPTPPADVVRIYPKADGRLYVRNWAGVEYDLTAVGGGGVSAIPSLCNGRLTLTSGTPITTTDIAGAATVFFTPYKGNQVALFNGTTWVVNSFTERSLSLAGLPAGRNCDIFLFLSGSTLTLEAVQWTSDTARAVALALQDGVLVRSGATGRRYLGTIRTTAAGQTEDSVRRRFVFNETHPVPRKLLAQELTYSWVYSTYTWRPANNNTANRVEVVIGTSGAVVDLNLAVRMEGTGAGSTHSISYDSINSHSGDLFMSCANNGDVSAHLVHNPDIGYHYYQWVENGRGQASTSFGTAGPNEWQSGINGTVLL